MPADPTPHGASASGADSSGAGASGPSGTGASRVGGSDTGYHPERSGGWTSGDAPQRLAQIALRDLPWEVGVAKPDPAVVVDGVTRTFGGLTAVAVDHLEV